MPKRARPSDFRLPGKSGSIKAAIDALRTLAWDDELQQRAADVDGLLHP
jgi:hypothetical protein